MEAFQIHFSDWNRILFGNVPFDFFIEVIIRVTFIYLLIIFSIRMMGKRIASQLSRNELVAISSLYFEADGHFTLVRNPEKKPGLSIIPSEDPEFAAEQHYNMEIYVCELCAGEKPKEAVRCPHCDNEKFVHPAF